jgi:hypothetical protein
MRQSASDSFSKQIKLKNKCYFISLSYLFFGADDDMFGI